MPFTEEDRPDCVDGCGRKAALSRGELAYKGRCSGCYKADVARRKAGRGDETVRDAAGAAPGAGAGGPVGGQPAVAGPGAAAPADAGAEDDSEPAEKRRHPYVCGWCCDGNHVAREPGPDREDELGLTVRGLPGTWGCAAEQVFLSGPRIGESRGLRCDCSAAGHDRSKLAAK